ncbi:response regulator [Clostridium cochlearium]|uniref:Stage 0 sporulation protein A homolog n=1 Tax=Clostridium cochlearium TaxID=1494 RepID=A0A1G9FL17_CLOCO|nr:response regulator [Clostridium cochlearium]NME95818.1 response regulator [Clostridium cochlearium]NOH15196.1 response regulator [Clostridium cochlearium]SDK89084.1 Response regulator receiver domain-containing protein [Clostridium cochlearium]
MKILIVDDSSFSKIVTSKLIKNFLKDVEVILASDGAEGFKKYKEVKPDYTFVDLLMPNINGKELIKLIKEYDKDSKIFVISADVQKSVREEVEAYGIMKFINKPFNEEKAKEVFNIIQGDING